MEYTAYGNRQKASNPIKEEANIITTGSSDFVAAPSHYQKLVSGLIEDARINELCLAKAAINPNVIERMDFDLLQAITTRRSWLKADLSWAEGLTKEQVRDKIREDANECESIMNIVVDDAILNRDDATQIINTTFNFETSEESKIYAKKTVLQSKLAVDTTFENTSKDFQENVATLVNNASRNIDYIARAVTNPSVVEREDFNLLEKVANATTWVDSNYANSLPKEEREEYLVTEAGNYSYMMNVLTEDVVLEQPNATAIMDAVFSCDSSSKAYILSERFLTRLKSVSEVESMAVEATAPQVQDTTGFSK